jgi:hypothetical protein
MLERPSLAKAVGALCVAAALLGCNASQNLDTSAVQLTVEQSLKDNAGVSATVTCPQRPMKQGDVFKCTGTTQDGTTLLIQVTQTDNAGHISSVVVGSN